MGTSVLHIKTEVECRIYLFNEEKGIAKPGTYFNLEVRKGEQDLSFVSMEDETVRCQQLYAIEESDSDYRITVERSQFKQYSQELLEDIRLAEQGDVNAQFRLGKRYYDGDRIEKDCAKAVMWWRKAAEQGYAKAQSILGNIYYVGESVEQDYSEAVKWFRKAAEQGNAIAQYNLGVSYEIGKGVDQDYDEAVKWYRKAAKQRKSYAQINLKRLEEKLNKQAVLPSPSIYLKEFEVKLNKMNNQLSSLFKHPYYLFFDTETTGVPRNYNAPASNTRNWPRLVQLGWIVSDEEGNVLSQGNEIVKPEGFVIPADAARVHGITTERAQREGKPLREVIEAFLKDAEQTKCIVGHNISFDQKVVGAELYRLGIPDTISTVKSLCTMQAGKDYCKIPGYYGYKWPKLQELHNKLFGCNFEDAHDAMADITATKKCFFEMRKRGLI